MLDAHLHNSFIIEGGQGHLLLLSNILTIGFLQMSDIGSHEAASCVYG